MLAPGKNWSAASQRLLTMFLSYFSGMCYTKNWGVRILGRLKSIQTLISKRGLCSHLRQRTERGITLSFTCLSWMLHPDRGRQLAYQKEVQHLLMYVLWIFAVAVFNTVHHVAGCYCYVFFHVGVVDEVCHGLSRRDMVDQGVRRKETSNLPRDGIDWTRGPRSRPWLLFRAGGSLPPACSPSASFSSILGLRTLSENPSPAFHRVFHFP
ncbi:hypothetical protein GE09DRAFT_609225 [Coniochaeta sp. 2T2.1]|nr:hypothetical protein GE09DRAFT_609225 [Coniochaeta sp. 2T2.1]